MTGHPRKTKTRWDEPGPCSELLPWLSSAKDMADHPRKKRTRWDETGPGLQLLPWSSTKDTAGHPPKKKTRWDQPRTNPELLPWPVPWLGVPTCQDMAGHPPKKASWQQRWQWLDAAIHRDILPMIFIRLPVTTLLEFRYVCKLWHEIISDPSLVYSHSERHQSNKNDDAIQLIIIPRNSNMPRTTNEIALYSYKMDGAANGLMRQSHTTWHVLISAMAYLSSYTISIVSWFAIPSPKSPSGFRRATLMNQVFRPSELDLASIH